MKPLKSQVDLENRLVHVADSKTENGIRDMPMTDLDRAANERPANSSTAMSNGGSFGTFLVRFG